MSSGHAVHRAQTRAPASRDIYGQRVVRAPPCSRRCHWCMITVISRKGASGSLGPPCHFCVLRCAPSRAYRCQQANPFFLSSRKRTRDKIWVHSLPAIKSEIETSVRGRRCYLTRSPRPFLARVGKLTSATHAAIFPTSQ